MLIAPEDSVLAGVRLKVPAGALTSKVTLTLDATNDAVPLGGEAEQVGTQVVVGRPAGVTFAAPVELTVPIDERSVSTHSQSHEDCKGWFRADATWARLERKASVEGRVTVELPAPGTAAAGVIARSGAICASVPSLCISGLTPKGPVIPTCTSPTGYCIVKLPVPAHLPNDQHPNFTIVGRQLYYVHVPGTDQISVARYDLDTGVSVLLGTVPTTASPEDTPSQWRATAARGSRSVASAT